MDVELWSKEAPLACRNFVQLAMEGYYDNCPIHRVIKDFMMQSGDPRYTRYTTAHYVVLHTLCCTAHAL